VNQYYNPSALPILTIMKQNSYAAQSQHIHVHTLTALVEDTHNYERRSSARRSAFLTTSSIGPTM
jgi:hypothetical protein